MSPGNQRSSGLSTPVAGSYQFQLFAQADRANRHGVN